MEENYYALLLAIFKNVDAKQAINYVKYGKITKNFLKNIRYDRLDATPEFNQTSRRNDYYKCNPDVIKKRLYKKRIREERYKAILELRKKNKTWKEIGLILNISPEAAFSRFKRYEKKEKLLMMDNSKAPSSISLNKNTVIL